MLVGQPRGAAAPGRPGQKAHLHQVGLTEIFQRDGLFAQSRCQRFQAHRAAVVHLDDGAQQAAVQLIQPQGVHVHPLEAHEGDIPVNDAVSQHCGKIADALQKAVGHTRRAPAALGQLVSTLRGDGLVQDARRALDDAGKLIRAVEFQLEQHAETVPQRTGDLARPGGGTHQREPGQVDPDALSAGALTDHDVQRIVLQCRVKHLFHLPGEAVDLVDEEDVALL